MNCHVLVVGVWMLSVTLSSAVCPGTVEQERIQCLEECFCSQVVLCKGSFSFTSKRLTLSLYSSFCLPICLWVVRTGCCVFDVVVLHELSKFLTSKLRSIVGYQLIWNSIPGDLTLQVWNNVLGWQIVQFGDFWPLWEVVHYEQLVLVVELKKICSDLLPRSFWNLHRNQSLLCVCSRVFCTHNAQAATLVSSVHADIPGQNKTCLALFLHLTMPRCVSWIFSNISDWSVLGTMILSPLNSKPSRQVSPSL